VRNLRVALRKPDSRNEVLATFNINDDLRIEAFGPKAGVVLDVINGLDGHYRFKVETTMDGTCQPGGDWVELTVDRTGKLCVVYGSPSVMAAVGGG